MGVQLQTEYRAQFQTHARSITNLEVQMGQIATSLNQREDEKLPSQTVANPRGQPKAEGFPAEHAHVVTTLWSGRRISEEVGNLDVPMY